MNNLEIFKNAEFGQVRTIVIEGEPMFCLTDICKALELSQPSKVKERLIQKGVSSIPTLTNGGTQNLLYINEANLYKAIFQSRKESAERFTDWITSEVLPTIRKTGGYVNNDDLFINTYLPFADEQTKVMFAQTLKTVREQNVKIQQQKEEILYKENVIIGLVDNIDLAEKRQRINQIIRHGKRDNYRERFSLLYSEFNKKYHCDIKRQMQNSDLKPKAKNVIDYIDRKLNMIPQLFELTCKLFENDVELLKNEWEATVK